MIRKEAYRWRPKRKRPEATLQQAVFQHLAARGAKDAYCFAVPNGGKRNLIEAANLKLQGVKAGVPDIICIHNGKCFALELKAEGGRATEMQLAAIAAMEQAGAYTAVAEGLDRALACLEMWGLLRGNAA